MRQCTIVHKKRALFFIDYQPTNHLLMTHQSTPLCLSPVNFICLPVYFFYGMFFLQFILSKFHFKNETALFMQNGRIWSFWQFVFLPDISL